MKDYDRSRVLYKLRRYGVKAKPDDKHVAYLEIPPYANIGLKLWGMIDSLRVKVVMKKSKPFDPNAPKEKRVRRQKEEYIGKCMICGKDVTNIDGLWSCTDRYGLVQLHRGACAEKFDFLFNTRLSLSEIEETYRLQKRRV